MGSYDTTKLIYSGQRLQELKSIYQKSNTLINENPILLTFLYSQAIRSATTTPAFENLSFGSALLLSAIAHESEKNIYINSNDLRFFYMNAGSTYMYHFKRLEKAGFIEVNRGYSRTFRVTITELGKKKHRYLTKEVSQIYNKLMKSLLAEEI